MQFQWWLSIIGLATTTIAAFLMFLFPPVVTVFTDAAERVISRVGSTSDTDRKVVAGRPRRSRLAVAVLFAGFFLQLVAALLSLRHGEAPAGDDAAATPAAPAGCEAARSAEECADILAKAGKNPYAAYGVVGRA